MVLTEIEKSNNLRSLKKYCSVTVNRSRTRGDSLDTKDNSIFGHIRKSMEFLRIQLAGAMTCYVLLQSGMLEIDWILFQFQEQV